MLAFDSLYFNRSVLFLFSLFIILYLLAASSCCRAYKYDELDKIIACHSSVDSSALKEKMIGTWDWQYIQCFWYPFMANTCDYEDHTLVFETDNMASVWNRRLKVETGSWQLNRISDKLYSIDSDLREIPVDGFIFLCDDQLLFYNSPVDGCDVLFRKGS